MTRIDQTRRILVLAAWLTMSPSAKADGWWQKPDFLLDFPDQKSLLTGIVQEWGMGAPHDSQSGCQLYLRDFKQILDEVTEARGNIGIRYTIRWQYCAARFFPADNAQECKTSIASYKELAKADARFKKSLLPSYLESFCGVL